MLHIVYPQVPIQLMLHTCVCANDYFTCTVNTTCCQGMHCTRAALATHIYLYRINMLYFDLPIVMYGNTLKQKNNITTSTNRCVAGPIDYL